MSLSAVQCVCMCEGFPDVLFIGILDRVVIVVVDVNGRFAAVLNRLCPWFMHLLTVSAIV